MYADGVGREFADDVEVDAGAGADVEGVGAVDVGDLVEGVGVDGYGRFLTSRWGDGGGWLIVAGGVGADNGRWQGFYGDGGVWH